VQLLTGSGTLANEVAAAELRKLWAPGLVLARGEFGRRLADMAACWGLVATVVAELPERPPLGCAWLWTTLCETSTGELLDSQTLKKYARRHNLHLCLDCMSALGVVDVDLRDVWLATASSGKGLAAGAGLALVFHNEAPLPSAGLSIPGSLDLATHAQGLPAYTLNSQSLAALHASLAHTDWPAKFSHIRDLYSRLAPQLPGLLPTTLRNPAVLTLAVPDAKRCGDSLKTAGVWVSYESGHLLERGWLQICLMGQIYPRQVAALPGILRTLLEIRQVF
jgi:aspartate aminotransferase-like enzyme